MQKREVLKREVWFDKKEMIAGAGCEGINTWRRVLERDKMKIKTLISCQRGFQYCELNIGTPKLSLYSLTLREVYMIRNLV